MHAKLLKSMLLCAAVAVAAPAEGRDLRAVLKKPAGPVLPCGADAVSCVWFDGTGLRDARANAWAMQGTVTPVAKAAPVPAGAGGFTTANYYSLGSGADALDVAGPFTVCIVAKPTSASWGSWPIIATDGDSAVDGWYLQATDAALAFFRARFEDGSQATVTASSAFVVNEVNVVCAGAGGGAVMVKTNLGAVASNAASGTPKPDATVVARLGSSAGSAFPGNIYGMAVYGTAPSDALFTAIQQSVKAKLGISAW